MKQPAFYSEDCRDSTMTPTRLVVLGLAGSLLWLSVLAIAAVIRT